MRYVRSHVAALRKLPLADALALFAVLTAAAEGWVGAKAEVLALLRSAPGGLMCRKALERAVLARHRWTHRLVSITKLSDRYTLTLILILHPTLTPTLNSEL